MAFVKEVTLLVKSVIENIEDGVVDHELDEITESTVSGFMKPVENGFFLTYSEDGDGGKRCATSPQQARASVCVVSARW